MNPRGTIGMKLLCTAAVLCAATTISFAAGLPASGLSGNYMEARTADVYTGPCFANGEVEINGKEAVFGWKINHGAWDGVSLAGLGVVGVVRSKHTLGDIHRPINPAIAVLIVDSRATGEQRSALDGRIAGRGFHPGHDRSRPHLRQRGHLLSAVDQAGACHARLRAGEFLSGRWPRRHLERAIPAQQLRRDVPGGSTRSGHGIT